MKSDAGVNDHIYIVSFILNKFPSCKDPLSPPSPPNAKN